MKKLLIAAALVLPFTSCLNEKNIDGVYTHKQTGESLTIVNNIASFSVNGATGKVSCSKNICVIHGKIDAITMEVKEKCLILRIGKKLSDPLCKKNK